jgi:hypothetical protein
MKKITKLKYHLWAGFSFYLLPGIMFAQSTSGSSTTNRDIKQMAEGIINSLGSVASLITSFAVLAGLGFGVAGIFKLKQHKDNPQQTPLGQPMMLIGVAVMLIWLPFLLTSIGTTMTGGGGDHAAIGTGAAKQWMEQSN